MADLGKAYVSIIPKAEGISDKISKILDPGSQAAGKKAGGAISQGLGNGIIKAGGMFTNFAASGAAAIAGIASGISSKAFGGGFARAMQIDNARAKMNQLGMETDKIMSNVNDSVSGTRYGLNEMASIAVNFASAGVSAGGDMTAALKSVASAASISGVDLNHMGAIFTKVASGGKVTGQVMTQLAYNGINANAALQKHFGKTEEEITKMVSSGKIGFKDFSDAMYEYFGDAALSANSTFSGAMANVGAAMSRIGAKFADPLQQKLREIFAGTNLAEKGGLMLALDNINKALTPVIASFEKFVGVVGDKVVNALNIFNDAMGNGANIMDAFKAAVVSLIPDSIVEKFKSLPEPVQNILSHLGKGAGIVAGVAAGFGVLSGAVGALIPGIGGLIAPLVGSGGAFKLVSSVGKTLFGVFGSLLGGSGAGGLTSVLGGLASPLGIIAALFGGAMAGSESFRSSIGGLVSAIGSSLQPVISGIGSAIQGLLPKIASAAGAIGDTLAPIIEELTPIITEIIDAVVNLGSTILTAIQPALSALLPSIQGIITVAGQIVTLILSYVAPVIEQLTPVIEQLVATVGSFVSQVAAALVPFLESLVPIIEKILNVVVPVVTTIVQFVLQAITGLINILTPIITGILNFITSVMNAIIPVVSGALNAVKTTFTTIWNGIKTFVTTIINGIKTVINGISTVVSGVVSTFTKVKEAITKPIQEAKDKVKGVIDKIKGFFPLSIGKIFSNLKLPHISVSGGEAPFGIAGKGSLPKFSVTWAAQGGIVDAATLIGAGEAGTEAIVPLDPFWEKMDDIRRDMQNRDDERIERALGQILSVLEYMADKDTTIKWNNREVGRLIHGVM